MKFSIPALATFFFCQLATKVIPAVADVCAPDALEFSETIAVAVEKIGAVPAINTDAFTYNMAVMDNFTGETIFFLDQKNGVIYSFNTVTSDIKTIFDIQTSIIPDGLTLDWSIAVGSSQTYRVKAMTQGSSSDEVIVVFTSETLPTGWSEPDAKLPPPGAYGQWICREGEKAWVADIYRPGTLPDCSDMVWPTFTGYDAFYKYTMVNGELTDPIPFFVSESAVLPGHLGSGIATTIHHKEKILWSTGDCTLFGIDGAYAPQLDHESCGKILLIDTKSRGKFDIVAKGVRNSQQMRIFTGEDSTRTVRKRRLPSGHNKTRRLKMGKKDKFLAFTDIGGVTAEEVNAVPLKDILDLSEIENFGWGRNIYDGKAREGTFYVTPGNAGVLGTEPACAESAPIGETGFIQPWIQFGRSATDAFYAISSLAVPTAGTDNLQLLWSEFNTGNILGTDEMFVEGAPPATGYKIHIYDADDGVYLTNGLNDLVQKELGDVGYYRGDPRLFHFPDGHAGVFIERTGTFYKISEMKYEG
mmetsp:Transcript_8166/g.11774  ORF Transcript_8166/g.11774 Transcript_8166/m.11774 type:complete len:529 (-) Transcript_8166:434-2020(-)